MHSLIYFVIFLLFFFFFFFFFNDTATTEIYTLSLHDALPINGLAATVVNQSLAGLTINPGTAIVAGTVRSEEHTSELQSQSNLVCRLLLEKKKKATELGVARHIKEFHVL